MTSLSNRTVTVFTKKGSVLVITEREGKFSLVFEELSNKDLESCVGRVFEIQRPSPWLPRITDEFIVYGVPGTPIDEGVYTGSVSSFEVVCELRRT